MNSVDGQPMVVAILTWIAKKGDVLAKYVMQEMRRVLLQLVNGVIATMH